MPTTIVAQAQHRFNYQPCWALFLPFTYLASEGNMYKSLFYSIHRAKRRCDVRRILAAVPSVILALLSVLFIALLLTAMQVAR